MYMRASTMDSSIAFQGLNSRVHAFAFTLNLQEITAARPTQYCQSMNAESEKCK
jgi:hypothetical protein